MRKIETASKNNDPTLTKNIQTFWTRNVNAERIMGKSVSSHTRGQNEYFSDIEKQRYRSHRHLKPWITSMQKDKSVLEIGSGIGIDSYTMAKHGLNVTALDLTEVGVKTAKKRFDSSSYDCKFLAGDACMLPIQDNSYDYVYSFGVLHHAADTEKTISEVYRVLRPSGEARIMLYHRHSINELVHRLTRIPFEDKDELCPVVRRFTLNEVQKIFKQFSKLNITLDYVFGEGYGMLFSVTPKPIYTFLSKHWGWHIMITAIK